MGDFSRSELIAMFAPLVILQFGLAFFCLVKIIKEGVANLNKVVWCIIVFTINLFGPIIFLLAGRRKDL